MIRKFPFRPLRGEARREYEHQRSAKYDWVFPKVEGDRTSFVDLVEYAKTVFPHSQARQGAFVAIMQVFAEKRKPLYLRDITYLVKKKVKVSNTTLFTVWKAMNRSKMLYKKHRQDPAQPSLLFVARLRVIGEYWENLIEKTVPMGRRRKRRD